MTNSLKLYIWIHYTWKKKHLHKAIAHIGSFKLGPSIGKVRVLMLEWKPKTNIGLVWLSPAFYWRQEFLYWRRTDHGLAEDFILEDQNWYWIGTLGLSYWEGCSLDSYWKAGTYIGLGRPQLFRRHMNLSWGDRAKLLKTALECFSSLNCFNASHTFCQSSGQVTS